MTPRRTAKHTFKPRLTLLLKGVTVNMYLLRNKYQCKISRFETVCDNKDVIYTL